jgi:hypothetical protein
MLDMGLPIEKSQQFWNTSNRGTDITKPNQLEVGKQLYTSGESYIVTEIIKDGNFKAVTKSEWDLAQGKANPKMGSYWKEKGKYFFNDLTKAEKTLFMEDRLESLTQTFDISTPKTTQQGIKLTPEVVAKIKGEAPVIKTSGKMFEEAQEKPKKSIKVLPKKKVSNFVMTD